jgi:hypothetical protein
VLLIFGVALILNMNISSATAVGQTHVSSQTTASGLTLAQMKDGLSRAQKFYNTNHRLPKYVSFGAKKIPISTFQKILATKKLKINTTPKKTINSASKTVNVNGTVSHYGWNSCSKGWFKTGGTFKNYCPICHTYGCLIYNPKHTYEGEWTCKHCDADFCNCGRCKAYGSIKCLIRVWV